MVAFLRALDRDDGAGERLAGLGVTKTPRTDGFPGRSPNQAEKSPKSKGRR
jgi:hypothetical protein